MREFNVQCYINKYENFIKLMVFMGCILRMAQRQREIENVNRLTKKKMTRAVLWVRSTSPSRKR